MEPGGDLFQLRGELQGLVEQLRKLEQTIHVRLRGVEGEGAANLRQPQREQVEGDELGGERFGRSDANLRSCVRVQRPVRFARGHAADDVADGDAASALALRLTES